MKIEIELTYEQLETVVREELIYHYFLEKEVSELYDDEDTEDSKKLQKALRKVIKYYCDNKQWKKFKKSASE